MQKRKRFHTASPDLTLEDGSRIAVLGGGPAGSFFSYFVLDMARHLGLDLRGALRMASKEQRSSAGCPRMSAVLWGTFTGSASYRDIFLRTLRPGFLLTLLREILAAVSSSPDELQRHILPHSLHFAGQR